MQRSSAVCVDANLIVEGVRDVQRESIRRLWERWRQERRTLAAPTLIHYEVTNALYQYQRHGLLSAAAAEAAQSVALRIPLEIHGDEELHRAALVLASRLQLGATYDAHYLALAQRLKAELFTADERLWRRVHAELPWVRLVR